MMIREWKKIGCIQARNMNEMKLSNFVWVFKIKEWKEMKMNKM